MTHTCTPVSLLQHSSFSEARKDSCLASEGPDSEDMSYQGSVDIEKHPVCVWGGGGVLPSGRAVVGSSAVNSNVR